MDKIKYGPTFFLVLFHSGIHHNKEDKSNAISISCRLEHTDKPSFVVM